MSQNSSLVLVTCAVVTALAERNVLQVGAGSTARDTFPRAGLIHSCALQAVIWHNFGSVTLAGSREREPSPARSSWL